MAKDDPRRVPLTIPTSQAYCWTTHWQAAERENLAELAAGKGIRFDGDDPEDIIRWLDAPDEPDSD